MASSHFAVMPPSPTRLRQIALVAKDLQRARHLLTTVLGTEVIYEDPAVAQWGLNNILVPLGGDIIEVVSPFRTNTPASRHLQKRGDSGYMIIMQTLDARARRDYIQEHGLAKVIFEHELEESVCIQYHPRGIKGGVIPELDSHNPNIEHPDPLGERFSPWHAAGPASSYEVYNAGMKRHADLHLLEVVLRLAPGDEDVDGAAKQWEDLFGVQRTDGIGEVGFTNAKMRFVAGEERKSEGFVEVVVGVEGRGRRDGILARASREGLLVSGEGGFDMLGVRWRLRLLSDGPGRTSRL